MFLHLSIAKAVGGMMFSKSAKVDNGMMKDEISVHKAPSGIYFIQIRAGNKQYQKMIAIQ